MAPRPAGTGTSPPHHHCCPQPGWPLSPHAPPTKRRFSPGPFSVDCQARCWIATMAATHAPVLHRAPPTKRTFDATAGPNQVLIEHDITLLFLWLSHAKARLRHCSRIPTDRRVKRAKARPLCTRRLHSCGAWQSSQRFRAAADGVPCTTIGLSADGVMLPRRRAHTANGPPIMYSAGRGNHPSRPWCGLHIAATSCTASSRRAKKLGFVPSQST